MDRALDLATGQYIRAKDADRNAEYICPNPKCAKKVTPRAINGYFYQRVSPYFAHAPNVADSDCQYYVENNYSGSNLANYLQIRPVRINSFSQLNKNKIYSNYYINIDENSPKLILAINFNYCFGDSPGSIIFPTCQGEIEISNRINSASNQIRKYEVPFDFDPKNIKFIGDVSNTVKNLASIKSINENNLNIFDGITGRLIYDENIIICKDYYVLIKKNALVSNIILKFCTPLESKIDDFDLYNFKLHSNLSHIEKSLIEDFLNTEIKFFGPKIYLINPIPLKIEDDGELIISNQVTECSFQLKYCSIGDIEFQFEKNSFNEFEVIEDTTIDQQHIVKVNLIDESSLTLYWKSSKAPILKIRKESILNYKEKALEITLNNKTYNLLDKSIYSSLKDGVELSLPDAQHFPQLKIMHKNRRLEINSSVKFIYKLGDTIDAENFGCIGSHDDSLNKKVSRDSKSINILKWLNANANINIENDDLSYVERKLVSKFGNNSPFLVHLNYIKNKETYDF